MKWTFRFLDLAQTSQPPTDFINRRDGEVWIYLDAPMGVEAPGASSIWRTVSSGDVVRVPLLPYCTHGTEPAVALAYAFQLGVQAFHGLNLDDFSVAHLSIGSPVEEFQEYIPIGKKHIDCFRLWLGIALRVKN